METSEGAKNLNIGIAGHQDLGPDETIKWVVQTLEKIIGRFRVKRGFTSLALGADQAFAGILRKKKIPYVAVIPCKNYEQTFETSQARDNYRAFLENADRVITLDFEEPEERVFYEAGKNVVDSSDLVIAVWDGQPAKGLGGTGDQVEYAKAKNKRIIHVNPIAKSVVEIGS